MALENPHAASLLAETEEEPAEETRTEFTREDLAEVLAEQARLSDERLARVLQGTRSPAPGPLQEEIRAPGITLEGLPDPTHDLQGFYRGLNERLGQRDQVLTNQVLERTQQTVQAATSNQALFLRAENMIKEAAPELDDAVIEFAAQKIASQYRARGVDPMDALRENLTGVAQEVLDYADDHFSARPEENLERKSGGGGRTQGIAPGGARVPRPAPRTKDENSNIVQEIKEMQSTLRLY